jgi:serine/threonine protein kinase
MTSDFPRGPEGSFGGLGPGSRVAGYLIEGQIGAGGMAVVFRARDELLGRIAAVKVIAPSMAGDQEFRARFLRESRAAAAVDSPHIVPVYGAGEAEGLLYIATRFVAGGDLARLVQRSGGRLAPDRACSFVSQVASALDSAHAAGLVHRDVKPANILVDAVPERPEHAYLSDFGLSKGTASTGLTAAGAFLGTPDYCAPEQIMGGGVDGRADQYALACVAFMLLTGTVPFRRQEIMATLFAHMQDPVPPVTGLRPELPAAVDGVIARALAKSPADRYSRCGEFAAALQEALAPAWPAGVQPPTALAFLPEARSVAGSQLPETQPPAGSQARQAADWSQPTQTANRGSGPPTFTPGGAEGAPRKRGKARAIWATAAAVVLAAGVIAVVGFHVLSPNHASPSGAPTDSATGQRPSQPAASTAHSPAAVGQVAATQSGSYTGADPNYDIQDPITFYVSGDKTQVQDILVPVVDLTCAPGGTQVTDHLAIPAATISADGSFSATATRQGVFHGSAGNYPATYNYSFKGTFTGVSSQGAVTASGTFSETMTYSDTTARTCSSNTQSWTVTRDAQPAQPTTLPPTGGYTGADPNYDIEDPITFYVSSSSTQLLNVLIPVSGLDCAPGNVAFDDHLGIPAIAIASNGSFSTTVTQQGVHDGYPAEYTYTFRGNFHGVNSSGTPRAAGTFSETVTYTDTAARSCTSDVQGWTATRDAQPAQTTTPQNGTYTGADPNYDIEDPITFSLSGNTLRNIAIPVVMLSCAPGGAEVEEPLSIGSAAVQPDGSFTATSTGSDVYAGHPATFTYTFRGNFEGVNASGVARAAGTFRETMKYTNGTSYTCDSNNQGWSGALTASG